MTRSQAIYDDVKNGGGGDGMTRRSFLQLLGAGLLVTTYADVAGGQPGADAAPRGSVAARLHIGEDGVITVMTGKVDVGQGARKQFTMAAAEELRAPMDRIRVILGDTGLTPDDGGTFGSRTTPSNIPDVRRACAAARELLAEGAARRWDVAVDQVTLSDGVATHRASGRTATYAELATDDRIVAAFRERQPDDVTVTAVHEWRVLGGEAPRPEVRDLVTGAHKYPSDIKRPGMLYGSVLRAPRYRSELLSVDTAAAEAIDTVRVVVDGDFVGCVAPTSHAARKGVAALAETATWTSEPHTDSADLFAHLQETATASEGRRSRGTVEGSTERAFADAAQTVEATYEVAYIQHVPMEPRAAVAEWTGESVTVWTGSQVPTRVREHRTGRRYLASTSPGSHTRAGAPDRRVRPSHRPRARDRAGHGRRIRRQALRRDGGRGRATREGCRRPRVATVDARRGVHLGVLPPGGGGTRAGRARRGWRAHGVGVRDDQRGRFRPRHTL